MAPVPRDPMAVAHMNVKHFSPKGRTKPFPNPH